MAPLKLDQFVNQSQEDLRLSIATQLMVGFLAGRTDMYSQAMGENAIREALRLADVMLEKHAATPIG